MSGDLARENERIVRTINWGCIMLDAAKYPAVASEPRWIGRSGALLRRPRWLPCAPCLARAADAAPAEEATGPLQEIVVTATRHEESLSKVPISVTALTQEAMDVRGIKDFQDVARFTPGVNIDNSGTNNISIRGIASTRRRRHHRHLHRRHADPDPRRSPSTPTMRCPSPSTSTASRCCAARRAPCSARAPKAAPCATSPLSRA